MSYIKESLGDNETLHYRAHFHWIYHVGAWSALIISAVIAFAVFTYQPANFIISIFIVLVGLAIFLYILIPIWTTEIGVTNQRLIFKRGWLQWQTQEMQLGSIEAVNFNQDFWGRMFDYGKLSIHGTGDEDMVLPSVGDPLALRSALQEAVGAAQRDLTPVKETIPPQGSAEPRPA